MRFKKIIVLALLALPVLAACGTASSGSDATPDSAAATYEAALEASEETPVSDSMREYAQQLCTPVKSFFEDISGTLEQLEEQATMEATPEDIDDAFGAFLDLFSELEVPVQDLRDDLDGLDVPDDLQDYHDAFVEQMEYLLDTIEAIKEDGFTALFALGTGEPTPAEPPGFEAGLLQECGEDLKDLLDEFGGDLFSGGDIDIFGEDDEATTTPPPPGTVGEAVRAGDFELTVNSVTNPYESTDEFSQPERGRVWILFDVSLTNVAQDTQDYSSFDFTLRDSDDFSYDATFVGADAALDFGSLRPDETIRGNVAFDLPVDTLADTLIFEPDFFGESRIDINLR